MQVSAYGIALIGGGFTIIGALLSYWPSRWLMDRNNIILAKSKLRSAFAPAQSQIRLARKTGDFNLKEFFDSAIFVHSEAFEVFRPFVSDSQAYEKAWDEYWETIFEDDSLADAAHRWLTGKVISNDGSKKLDFLDVIKEKIDAILHFAPIK